MVVHITQMVTLVDVAVDLVQKVVQVILLETEHLVKDMTVVTDRIMSVAVLVAVAVVLQQLELLVVVMVTVVVLVMVVLVELDKHLA